MNEYEFKDFINLIKTTSYWTDAVSEQCYDVARSRFGYTDFIMKNYAMGYFNSIKSEKLMKDLNLTKDDGWYISKYLPVFENSISEDDLKSINVKKLGTDKIAYCRRLMKNREILKSGARGRVYLEK